MKWFVVKCVLVVWLFVMISGFISSSKVENVNFDTLVQNVESAGDTEGMAEADSLKIKEFYGINRDDYEGVILLKGEDTMDVREILIVKALSKEQANSLETAVNDRKEKQLKSFEGYGVEQTKILNDSVISVEGVYVLFAVSPDSQNFYDAFYNTIKK